MKIGNPIVARLVGEDAAGVVTRVLEDGRVNATLFPDGRSPILAPQLRVNEQRPVEPASFSDAWAPDAEQAVPPAPEEQP